MLRNCERSVDHPPLSPCPWTPRTPGTSGLGVSPVAGRARGGWLRAHAHSSVPRVCALFGAAPLAATAATDGGRSAAWHRSPLAPNTTDATLLSWREHPTVAWTKRGSGATQPLLNRRLLFCGVMVGDHQTEASKTVVDIMEDDDYLLLMITHQTLPLVSTLFER